MFIKRLKDRKLLLVILSATLICLSYIGYRSFENVSLTEDIVLLPEDFELVALGKQVYATHCASCHGVNLEGQTNWQVRGPDGKLPAPPHDQKGHTWHHSDAHLFELTKYGVEKMIGQKYPNNMPAYAEILSDREIIAVLSFIKRTWPKEIQRRHDLINSRARTTQ